MHVGIAFEVFKWKLRMIFCSRVFHFVFHGEGTLGVGARAYEGRATAPWGRREKWNLSQDSAYLVTPKRASVANNTENAFFKV